MTTEERLAAIRQREQAATPGSWTWKPPYELASFVNLENEAGQRIHSDGSACGEYGADIDVDGPNGQFMAHARDDIPFLLAEVDRLRLALSDLDPSP